MLSIIEIKDSSIFIDKKIIKKREYAKMLAVEDFKQLVNLNNKAITRQTIHEYVQKKLSSYEEGLEDAKNSYLDELITCSKKYKAELAEIEGKMIEIIAEVTEKVAYSVSSSEYIKGALKDALSAYRDDLVVTYLSPAHRETLKSFEEDMKERFENDVLKVRFDENLSDTSCIVETKFGQVDLSRDTKVKNYREAITKANNI